MEAQCKGDFSECTLWLSGSKAEDIEGAMTVDWDVT
jgi:hypothetical protein